MSPARSELAAFIRVKGYNRGMLDVISVALKGHSADYIEMHFKERQATSIVYRGERLEEISRARNSGDNIRALVQRNWGFVLYPES